MHGPELLGMNLRTDSARAELVVLTKLSFPVICTNLLAYLLQVVGQIFLGRLGASSLAAAALGNSYFVSVHTARVPRIATTGDRVAY